MNLPKEPTFKQKGLEGFAYPLKNKELEVYYVNITKGHDNFIISKTCTHIYYILEGKGKFMLAEDTKELSKGDLIEIEPNIEYAYSGNMKALLIMNPPWFEGNEVITKKNPDV